MCILAVMSRLLGTVRCPKSTKCCAGDQIEKKETGKGMWHVWETREMHTVLVERPEGRRQIGRPRHRGGDSTKMHLQKVRWKNMDWIDVAQNRDR